MAVPVEKLRLYERLVAAAGIDANANFGASYTAVSGNMFGIRLPATQSGICCRSGHALTLRKKK